MALATFSGPRKQAQGSAFSVGLKTCHKCRLQGIGGFASKSCSRKQERNIMETSVKDMSTTCSRKIHGLGWSSLKIRTHWCLECFSKGKSLRTLPNRVLGTISPEGKFKSMGGAVPHTQTHTHTHTHIYICMYISMCTNVYTCV